MMKEKKKTTKTKQTDFWKPKVSLRDKLEFYILHQQLDSSTDDYSSTKSQQF